MNWRCVLCLLWFLMLLASKNLAGIQFDEVIPAADNISSGMCLTEYFENEMVSRTENASAKILKASPCPNLLSSFLGKEQDYFCGCHCSLDSGKMLTYNQQTTQSACSTDPSCIFFDKHRINSNGKTCTPFKSSHFFPTNDLNRRNNSATNSSQNDLTSSIPNSIDLEANTSFTNYSTSVDTSSRKTTSIPDEGNLFVITLRPLLEIPVDFVASILQIIVDGH